MGNNNTSIQDDKSTNGEVPQQKDGKRKYNKMSKKSSAKNSPETSPSMIDDQIPEESISEPIFRSRFGSLGNRKISPTQQIFLDNVILPLGNEINARISKTRKLGMIEEEKKSNSVNEKRILEEIISKETHPKHHRAPAGLSRELNPNVAALIAGSDEKTEHKKYPVVFEYTGTGEEVFLSGCFNNWEKIKMSKNKRPNDFISVIDLKQGRFAMLRKLFLFILKLPNSFLSIDKRF